MPISVSRVFAICYGGTRSIGTYSIDVSYTILFVKEMQVFTEDKQEKRKIVVQSVLCFVFNITNFSCRLRVVTVSEQRLKSYV